MLCAPCCAQGLAVASAPPIPMFKKLRILLVSIPSITILGLVVVYLLLGFWGLPAVLKWQLEKQLAQRGHQLQIEAIRFNPLRLDLEVDAVALRDGQGQHMAGFAHLALDMRWRSIIDGAWTFADARLVSPRLRLDLAPDGQTNFSALIAQFASDPAPQDAAPTQLPRLRLALLAISDGAVEWFDQTLAPPLVTHVQALALDLRGLSTLPQERTQYRLSVRSAADESLELHGEFGLDPLLAQGQLTLSDLQVATLARGLARQVALQSPAGRMSLTAGFELASDPQGQLAGKVQALALDMTDLSLQAPDARAPLLAARTIRLQDGLVDLGQRDVRFGRFALRDAAVALALDAQGQGDWMRMLRFAAAGQPAPGDTAPAAPVTAPPSAPGSGSATASATPELATPAQPAPGHWRVAIDDARIDRLAVDFRDPSKQRSMALAGLNLSAAPSAQWVDAGANLTLGRLQLLLTGLQWNDGLAAWSVPTLQTDAAQSVLQFAGARMQGQFDTLQLSLAQGAFARQGDDTATLGAIALAGGKLALDSGPATGGLTLEQPRLELTKVAAAQATRSARLDKLSVQGDRLALDWRDGTRLQWDKPALDLTGLQLADTAQELELELAGLTSTQPALVLRQGSEGLSVQVQEPDLRLRALRARQAKDTVALAALQLAAGAIDVAQRAAAWDIGLTGLRVDGQELAAAGANEALELASLALGSAALKLRLDGNRFAFDGTTARLALGTTRLRQGEDVLAMKRAALTVGKLSAESAAPSTVPGAMRAGLQDTALSLDAIGLTRGSGTSAFATLAGAEWSAANLALALSDTPLDLRGDGMALRLNGAALRDPAEDAGAQLLQLGQASVQRAGFSLRDRSLRADALVAQDARADLWLDRQGQLNLMALFDRLSGAAPGGATTAATPPATTLAPEAAAGKPAAATVAPAWRVVVQQLDLKQSSAQFADRRLATPFMLGVDDLTLQARALDTAAPEPMQVDLAARLRSGGSLSAKGTVQVNSGAADLQLELEGLALAPVQSYLSEYLALTLDAGTASTQGRLVLGGGAADTPQLRFTGGFSVDRLLLQEDAPKRPFLSWRVMRTDDLALTLKPDRLDIGELQLQGPDGRLIIAQDQSINLTDVLKKREPVAQDQPAQAPVAVAKAETEATESPVFPVQVARVRVSDGVLDFADLSLRPQFGTRMHELKGVITGLSTDPQRVAKVQLDARVDKFGSARIRGQASLLQPDRLTEIDMAFRNLEMSALSPYVVKFAGYEIASGKLSLDLQYTVRDGKLLGENKVVLNQMALGRKVESPGALDVPLELALAVLKDSNGVIDIGLPVSGDLNDPKFDYGAVIGKAIGNLLVGIVTAPFRALAALFGGGADAAIDTIAFEPGDADLAPPEQQKVATVARALQARPQLLLKVAPVFAPRQDTPVLQSRAVRTEVALGMGLTLAPNEDPGPIDAANPRAAQAIEAAFSARYAPAVLELLKQRAMPSGATAGAPGAVVVPQPATPASAPASASVPAAPAGVPEPTVAASAAPAPAAPAPPVLPPAFHQALLERMIAEHKVTQQDLDALAQRRAQVIVARLTGDEGLATDRVALSEVREAADATDQVVLLKLQLDAIR